MPVIPMNRIRIPVLAAGLITLGTIPAQSQFEYGATYLMSAIHPLPPNQLWAGIARVNPTDGVATPFVQFTSNGVAHASAAYDPFRDRIVCLCTLAPSANPKVYAIDADANATALSSTYLHRLTPRGDGKIYCYKPAAPNPTIQQIFFLDANDQEQVLMDVGGSTPWLLNGGTPVFGDPIRAMIYEPSENALFLAIAGNNQYPTCSGAPGLEVSIRKLPLTADGTALRAPAICSQYDVTSAANVVELPTGFSYGPQGRVLLGVYASTSGAMPRVLQIDPVTAQASPFVTIGPYTGDTGFSCAAYVPTSGRVLVFDSGNDQFRSYLPGESGGGQILAGWGPPGLGASIDTMFVVAPIGPKNTLTADVASMSIASGGVQNLDFHPGPAFGSHVYLIAGSLSGWSPGFPFGAQQVPLNPDWYTQFTFDAANSQFLVNTFGILPPNGAILAQAVFPPQVLNGLQGLTMHHAAIVADWSLNIVHASNPVPLQLSP